MRALVEDDGYTRGLHRGGLTPACGFAHACNGRGCRQIEAVNATVLPRSAPINFHGLSQVEQRKTKQTVHSAPYTELYQVPGKH